MPRAEAGMVSASAGTVLFVADSLEARREFLRADVVSQNQVRPSRQNFETADDGKERGGLWRGW